MVFLVEHCSYSYYTTCVCIVKGFLPIFSKKNRVGGVVTDPASHTTGHAGPHPAVPQTASTSKRAKVPSSLLTHYV